MAKKANADLARAAELLRVGSLELDLVTHRGRRGDRSFDLRRREAQLLSYMMKAKRPNGHPCPAISGSVFL